MACPKTSKCGCPGVRCMIPHHCRGITKSVCRKPSRKSSRKPVKSRRRKSACKYGVKKSGGCKKKPGSKRKPPKRKSKSRRKPPKRKSKSRRKPPKRKSKSRRKPPKRKSKSRRKPPKRKSKSRRKSPKRKSKSRRKPPKRKSKSRRKPPKRKSKSRRKSPRAGWSKLVPNSSERTTMLKKCGKKCFLGPDKSFPICAKGTCKVNDKGLHASYVRAKQWGQSPKKYKGKSKPTMSRSVYQKIARSAKSRLARRGYIM